MVAFAGLGGQLYGHGSAPVNGAGSAVGWRHPGDAAKADPLIVQLPRFFDGGLAVDAVRIDLAVVNAAGLFRKTVSDIVAVGFDLPTHLDQRRTELRGGDGR